MMVTASAEAQLIHLFTQTEFQITGRLTMIPLLENKAMKKLLHIEMRITTQSEVDAINRL